KKLIGKRMMMSFSDNRTFKLWRSFMPGRHEIQNNIGADLYSIEVYPPSYWTSFNSAAEFEKWAAVEVTDFGTIPDGLESIILPDGLYAVFVHKGPASSGPKTYGYIFGTWLPDSEFSLDNRPHFALMGQKYKHDDPDSEEEIWIPIKPKISD
ncbi:MAG TPA: GyrI-like domain-containing protein, partial [Dongiaceae bacterium]|nr:GyrI-like domain-containing protein [Dongiaceae bacterium]